MTSTAPRPDRSLAVKDAIRAAATKLFAEHGFTATSVREIAKDAGSDPALVIRHFGSKEGLFLETMALPSFWTDVLDGPVEAVGERLARALIEARGSKLGVYTALIRASDRSEVRERLAQSMTTTLIEPISRLLDPQTADLRARLFAAQMDGLLTALAIREDPVLLTAPVDELVAWFGPLFQAALTGAAPALAADTSAAH